MTDLWAAARAWWLGEVEPVKDAVLSAERLRKVETEHEFTTDELRFRVLVSDDFAVYGSAAADNAPELLFCAEGALDA